MSAISVRQMPRVDPPSAMRADVINYFNENAGNKDHNADACHDGGDCRQVVIEKCESADSHSETDDSCDPAKSQNCS